MSDVLINLVLDRSGSMSEDNKTPETIEGLNAFFREQREQEGKALLSMTLFDTNFEVRFVGHDLREVADLGSADNPYSPRGGTALYDAVLTTIKGTDQWLLNHRDFTGKVVCVINTDGEENSSRATLDQVNDAISEKQEQGWEFVFMGVGKAAWTEGQKFAASIPQSNYFRSSEAVGATTDSYVAVSSALTNTRSSGVAFANATPDKVIGEDD